MKTIFIEDTQEIIDLIGADYILENLAFDPSRYPRPYFIDLWEWNSEIRFIWLVKEKEVAWIPCHWWWSFSEASILKIVKLSEIQKAKAENPDFKDLDDELILELLDIAPVMEKVIIKTKNNLN